VRSARGGGAVAVTVAHLTRKKKKFQMTYAS
jgi:hypothetical protein